MAADFETIAGVLGFLGNGALLAALGSLLSDDELEKLSGELSDAIGDHWGRDRSAPNYVRKKRNDLRKKLFSGPVIAVHLACLAILIALAVVLSIGPDALFGSTGGAFAEPLTPLETVVYWAWFGLSTLIYLVSGVRPTYRLWRRSLQATAWLETHGADTRPKTP